MPQHLSSVRQIHVLPRLRKTDKSKNIYLTEDYSKLRAQWHCIATPREAISFLAQPIFTQQVDGKQEFSWGRFSSWIKLGCVVDEIVEKDGSTRLRCDSSTCLGNSVYILYVAEKLGLYKKQRRKVNKRGRKSKKQDAGEQELKKFKKQRSNTVLFFNKSK
jgi:hypothetical protein